MRAYILWVASAALCAQATSLLCYPANDGTCLSWRVDATNITFTATFGSDASGGGVPVWGAWGLPALSCGNMWPAHVWLALPTPAGGVSIEDRVTVGHAAPQCAARVPQLSHTLSGAVAADGSVSVTWTRPLAPPPAFQQPTLARGAATALISAYALGASALAFPPCSTAGLPFHTNVLNNVSADLFSGVPGAAQPAAALPAGARRYAGLAGIAAVCGDACAALTHLNASTGRVSFPSAASPPLFPMLTALDSAARVVHVLAFDNSPTAPSPALFVASLSADTGELLGSCPTAFARNDDFDLANVNFAFDSSKGEVLIASCTDGACVAPLNVTALRPGTTCASRHIASLAAEEFTVGGSGAVDPYARVLVLTLARGGAKPGLAVVALNIDSGATVRVTPEAQGMPAVQSLVFDDVSRQVYGLAFTTAGASQPLLVAVNAATGRLRTIAAVVGCAGALPDSLAVSSDGVRLFFVGAGGGGGATLFSIFAANASVASAVPLQGAISLGDAPSALFWLPQ